MKAVDFVLPTSDQYVSDRLSFDLETNACNTLWVTMKKEPAGATQNFSVPLLHHLSALVHTIKEQGPYWHRGGRTIPIHYAVMRSEHPDYFSLGGDLKHFRDCIGRQDKHGLYQYSRLCMDMLYDWAGGSGAAMTTIALVQGRALGGGFEAALGADVLIAEEHSEFGFPEIMFGLFPCTGGMSLLTRRVGAYQAERMMTNARIYTARELKEMGVVDEVCPRGEGNLAVTKFIANHAKRRLPRLMVQRSRKRIAPLDYAELLTVLDEWVDVAMGLGAVELRAMDMLIMMQTGLQKENADAAHTTAAQA